MARGLTVFAIACLVLLATWLLLHRPDHSAAQGNPRQADSEFSETESGGYPQLTVPSVKALQPCEPYDPHAQLSEAEAAEAWEQESAMLVNVLRASEDAEHLATAALILATRHPAEAADLMDRAAALAPDDPRIAWLRLEHCGRLASDCGGRLDRVERDAIRVDGGNAAVWASIAVIRQRNGDKLRAAEALRLAAGASDYNAWIGELVLVFDRGLAAASSEPSLHRLARAFALTAGVYSAEVFIIRLCKEHSAHSPDWLNYCTRLGEIMIHHAREYLHRSIGFSLLEAMYELDGDVRRREALEAQRATLVDSLESTSAVQWDYLSRDESLLRAYLDVWVAADELAAMEFAEKEIERLASVPGYDPCELPAPGG